MAEIEYFYSAQSAYAYLGSRKLMAIARASGRRIRHRPYDLRKGIVAVGSSDIRTRPDNHRAYFFGRDMLRWAEHRGLAMLPWPSTHRNDITLANCMLIATAQASGDVDALADAMLSDHWCTDADLSDPDTLRALADRHGVDGAAMLEAARSDAVSAQYERNTAEAIERSVFGSPTYFVDGDMFYGQDHLELVERALHRPYTGQWPPAGS